MTKPTRIHAAPAGLRAAALGLGLAAGACGPTESATQQPGISTGAVAPPGELPPWVRQIGDASTDLVLGVTVDGDGDIWVTGAFQDFINIGGVPLVGAGGFDIFVARYDRRGELRWARSFGGAGDDLGTAISDDGQGGAYLAGAFHGTLTLGAGSLVSAGGADLFLAGLDPDGGPRWSRRHGGPGEERPFAAASAGTGGIALVGTFTGTTDLGGGSLDSAGDTDFFVATYGADGAPRWSRRGGGAGPDGAFGVALGPAGEVAVTGAFAGSAVLADGGPTYTAQGRDVFLVRYPATGSSPPPVVRTYGGPDDDVGSAVAYDSGGNLLLAGSFARTINLGSGVLRSAGDLDGFLAKLSPRLAPLFARRLGGSSYDVPFALAALPGDEVAIAGVFAGSAGLGGTRLQSAGGFDAFVAQYSRTGKHRFSLRMGGDLDDRAFVLAAGPGGELAVGGDFQSGNADFSGKVLGTHGGVDGFLTLLPAGNRAVGVVTVEKESEPFCVVGFRGEGTVTSDKGGIRCGNTCIGEYNRGTAVTLTAAPAAGSAFVRWGGACAGQGNPCTLTVEGEMDVTATFVTTGLELTVSNPGGGGYVTVNGGGACGGGAAVHCCYRFPLGAAVTLQASYAPNVRFSGWGGACAGSPGETCALTIDGPVRASASLIRTGP